MKTNRWILIVVIVAAVLILGLCTLTVVGGYTYIRRNQAVSGMFTNLDNSAQVSDEHTMEVDDGTGLVMDVSAGDIYVTTGAEGVMEFEMNRTAWGENADEAAAVAEALNVDFSEHAGDVQVTFRRTQDEMLFGKRNDVDRIDFTVRVPAGTDLELTTNYGTIYLQDVSGEVVLDAAFGEVQVEGLQGELQIKNQNGHVRLQDVDAGSGEISVMSNFGGIDVENLEAGTAHLETQNGGMTLKGIQTIGKIELSSLFGDIELTDFSGADLVAESDNGGITLVDGELSGKLKAGSFFQDIVIQDVSAENYTANSNNGAISLQGASGRLQLGTSFGDIEVSDAQDAILQVRVENGSIRFSGSLAVDEEHSLEGSFGDIDLTIPEDSSFDVVLETEFGSIRSDMPLTLQGEFSQEHMSGSMNAGGPLLHIKTSNGNISITAQKVYNEGE